ncbi:hypothetical protein BC826DRAFT_981002 [Russula brevipes]|nr:hypothetical protein BC826DRAFT_981002 [Russula brevipes]
MSKMMLHNLPTAFLGTIIIAVLGLVHAHPIWHDFNSRNSIESLLTGSTCLHAGVKFGVPYYYLDTPRPPGSIGDLTISFLSSQDDAPLFFLKNGHLLHHTNGSYIFHVNVLNVTRDMDDPLPYKLVLANCRDDLLDTMWTWSGAFLHLDHGDKSNNGLYYKCVSKDGRREGVYTSFDL